MYPEAPPQLGLEAEPRPDRGGQVPGVHQHLGRDRRDHHTGWADRPVEEYAPRGPRVRRAPRRRHERWRPSGHSDRPLVVAVHTERSQQQVLVDPDHVLEEGADVPLPHGVGRPQRIGPTTRTSVVNPSHARS